MDFLMMVLKGSICFSNFGRLKCFEGLSGGWDPKTMSQINGLVKGQIHGSGRRRKNSQHGKVAKAGRTRGKVEVLVRRTSDRLLRFGLDRGLLQLLLCIGWMVSLSLFSLATTTSSLPLPIPVLLVLLLLELGILVILPFNHAELVSLLLVTLGACVSMVLPRSNHGFNGLSDCYMFTGSFGRLCLDHGFHGGQSF